MRLPRNQTRKAIAVLVACIGTGYGAFVGISSAASSSTSNQPSNTAGLGGHPYPTASSNAAVAAKALPAPVQGELSSIGATSAVPLASIGGGTEATEVYSVVGANGAVCIEFAHAAGTIAEAPNCASGAYLRVSSIVNGTGDPEAGAVTSMQVVAVVSTEVATVHVTFSDGSSRDFTPGQNGIVTLQALSGQSLPTSISAIDSAGATLATLEV